MWIFLDGLWATDPRVKLLIEEKKIPLLMSSKGPVPTEI